MNIHLRNLNYYVNLRRRDRATVSISSWRSNYAMVVYSNTSNGLETTQVNKEMARIGYSEIVKLQRKIAKANGKAPNKELSRFTISDK